MSEVRTFRITGKMRLQFEWARFTKEIRALKEEHALEKLYSLLGSNHKVKRNMIVIEKIEVVPQST